MCVAVVLAVNAWAAAAAQRAPSAAGVTGVVTSTMQATLSYADVSIDSRLSVFTDLRGRFVFVDVPPGPHTILVRHIGYKPTSVRFEKIGGQPVALTVALTPLALELQKIVVTESVCPGRDLRSVDTAIVSILQQVQLNAERNRALVREYPFELTMQRLLTEEHRGRGHEILLAADSVTIPSESGWRYAPGKLLSDTTIAGAAGYRMTLPQLVDFADQTFADAHCFRYAGITRLEGRRVLRVVFEPTRALGKSDVNGSLYLDPATYQLVQSTMYHERRSPVAMNQVWDVRVDTWFTEAFPGIPIIDHVMATTTTHTLNSLSAVARQAVVDRQRVLAVAFTERIPGDSNATGTIAVRPARLPLMGRVVDSSLQPLAGASVMLSGGARTATTDGSGRFRMDSLERGIYELHAGRVGYLSQKITAVVDDDTLPIEVVLVPMRSPMASFSGWVLRDSTRQPIADAEVSLPTIDKRGTTNDSGAFLIEGIPAGSQRVVVRHMGYAPLDQSFTFVAGQTLRRRVLLTRVSELDTVSVTAEAIIPSFDEHRRIGLGVFLTRQDIARHEMARMASVLEQERGIRIIRDRLSVFKAYVSTKRSPTSRSIANGHSDFCYPQVYIDRVRVYSRRDSEPPFDVNTIPPTSVEAIEYYDSPASTPPEYSTLNSECGVIVFWTRRAP